MSKKAKTSKTNTKSVWYNSQAVCKEGIELPALCVLYSTGLDNRWVDDLGLLRDQNETKPEAVTVFIKVPYDLFCEEEAVLKMYRLCDLFIQQL